ncbi:MAG TPA: hypothetical protein DCL21_05590 [Alphaproteobacteria bacterium]|nr:hypothetical protein [Alphaproteobacteria bacterium]
MNISTAILYFDTEFNKIVDIPDYFLTHQKELPTDWQISCYHDKNKERHIYDVYWNHVLIGKVKVYNADKKESKTYEDAKKMFCDFYRSAA